MRFGKEFGQDWIEELRGRAKILLGRLSPARDLDVFTSKLLASPPKSGISDGLPQLRSRAESRARYGLGGGDGLHLRAPISSFSPTMSRPWPARSFP